MRKEDYTEHYAQKMRDFAQLIDQDAREKYSNKVYLDCSNGIGGIAITAFQAKIEGLLDLALSNE